MYAIAFGPNAVAVLVAFSNSMQLSPSLSIDYLLLCPSHRLCRSLLRLCEPPFSSFFSIYVASEPTCPDKATIQVGALGRPWWKCLYPFWFASCQHGFFSDIDIMVRRVNCLQMVWVSFVYFFFWDWDGGYMWLVSFWDWPMVLTQAIRYGHRELEIDGPRNYLD